jgi:hypothetical protein
MIYQSKSKGPGAGRRGMSRNGALEQSVIDLRQQVPLCRRTDETARQRTRRHGDTFHAPGVFLLP